MRANRILILLMIPLIIEGVIACCNCDEIPYTNYSTYWYYTNNGMIISNIDNSGPEPILAQTDSVLKCAYGIRLLIDRVESMQDTSGIYWGEVPWPERPRQMQGLIQSAYALSCWCDEERMLLAADTITSIEIITNNDFDIYHPAGSDIGSLFRILYSDYLTKISDIIIRSSEEYYTEPDDIVLVLDLLLMQEPNNAGLYDFTVRITLSDERILEQSTQITLI